MRSCVGFVGEWPVDCLANHPRLCSCRRISHNCNIHQLILSSLYQRRYACCVTLDDSRTWQHVHVSSTDLLKIFVTAPVVKGQAAQNESLLWWLGWVLCRLDTLLKHLKGGRNSERMEGIVKSIFAVPLLFCANNHVVVCCYLCVYWWYGR